MPTFSSPSLLFGLNFIERTLIEATSATAFDSIPRRSYSLFRASSLRELRTASMRSVSARLDDQNRTRASGSRVSSGMIKRPNNSTSSSPDSSIISDLKYGRSASSICWSPSVRETPSGRGTSLKRSGGSVNSAASSGNWLRSSFLILFHWRSLSSICSGRRSPILTS